MFDEVNDHRRRSSLVASEAQSLRKLPSRPDCFIHSLLEGQGKSPKERNSKIESIEKKESHDSVLHSRLLTKKQLSDMAWGVREIAKKLGSLKLKLNVQTVFLLTKAHDEQLIGYTREVTRWLLSKERDTSFKVYVENTLKENKKFDAKSIIEEDPSYETRLQYWTEELCRHHPNTFDFVITVSTKQIHNLGDTYKRQLGGDGTVLYASWLFQRIVPPVLSFALGSLGFLTKFDFHMYPQTLTEAFTDGITVGLRLRFEGTIMRTQKHDKSSGLDLVEELISDENVEFMTHKPDGHHQILNDIVVDRGPSASKYSIFQVNSSLTSCSNVINRTFWRRRAFYHRPS